MQLIHKKNYFVVVCVVYTILSLSKLIMEALIGHKDTYYSQNIISLFVITLVATLILSAHYYLQDIPLVIVIIGQYVVLIGMVMSAIWLEGQISPINETAYRDMFLSVSIPYLILMALYYIHFFHEVKKLNESIQVLKKRRQVKNEE